MILCITVVLSLQSHYVYTDSLLISSLEHFNHIHDYHEIIMTVTLTYAAPWRRLLGGKGGGSEREKAINNNNNNNSEYGIE